MEKFHGQCFSTSLVYELFALFDRKSIHSKLELKEKETFFNLILISFHHLELLKNLFNISMNIS